MLRKNKSVSLDGLHESMRIVLHHVDQVCRLYGHEAVITAGTEIFNGIKMIHSAGSFHNIGRALDFRTRFFSQAQKTLVVNELRMRLGKDYDVVLESDHMHIEYDPQS